LFTLSNQSVEVLVVGKLNAQIALADVVDSLIVDHEAAVRVFERSVSGEDRIVWLDDRCSDLGSRVDAELELALLAIVNRQTLHQQGTKARASTATERVEDQEALKTAAIVGDSAYFVEDLIDQLFTDSVVSTSIVV
jgi:hypothetical protein